MNLRKQDDYKNQFQDPYQNSNQDDYPDPYRNYNRIQDMDSELYAPPVYREDGALAGSDIPERKNTVKKAKIILIIIGIILLLPSLGCIGFGIYSYFEMKESCSKSVPVTAEIVSIRTETEDSSLDDDAVYEFSYPTVRYNVDGAEYEQEYEFGKGAGEYKVGQKIEIRYMKDDPEILSYGMDGMWVVLKTLIIAAICMAITPVLIFIVAGFVK